MKPPNDETISKLSASALSAMKIEGTDYDGFMPFRWYKPIFMDPNDPNSVFGVLSIDETELVMREVKMGDLKFTLEPNGEPYIPSLNEIADWHDQYAGFFPDHKDAQWHLQAAKHLREIGNEQARTD